MLQIKAFSFNPFEVRTLLLWDESGCGVVVDPACVSSAEETVLENYISEQKINLSAIWLTHAHIDHIYGVASVARKYNIPVRLSSADTFLLEKASQMANAFGMPVPDTAFETSDIADGEKMSFGSTVFEAIATPGHTPGGMCFFDAADKVLISGDTLFAGTIGRTDLPGGDYDKLIVSVMDKLMGFDGDVDILPGHGPCTTISAERTQNPFLQPFNEPDEEYPQE